jgi:hypothetical protein
MSYNVYQSGSRKGVPKTLTDRVIRFLTEGLLFEEVPSHSRYRQFYKASKVDGKELKWFVGKAGAVRAGKNASNSFSITDRVHANMKLWEKKEGKMI